MKSLFLPTIHVDSAQVGSTLLVEDSKELHHLLKVLRLRADEKVLLFNGQGSGHLAKMQECDPRSRWARFVLSDVIHRPRPHGISLAVGKIKRPALEEVFIDTAELGVRELVVLQTDFSQNYELKASRVQELLKQAYQQSNNLHEMQWRECSSLEVFLQECASAKSAVVGWDVGEEKKSLCLPPHGESIFSLVGPEGGWSPREKQLLSDGSSGLQMATLDTPILRTPTACSATVGYLLAKYR